MKIKRIYDELDLYLKQGKVLIIYGPRQVGKTTLIKSYLAQTKWKYRYDVGDDIRIQEVLSSMDSAKLSEYVQGFDLIAIDEAQKIHNIGISLKIIIDKHPNLRIIATGSSSFELSGQVGEPLTGRKKTLTLYPISHLELLKQGNPFDLKSKITEHLIYGSYPEVLTLSSIFEKKDLLNELTGSYLLRDILELDKIKSSKVLLDLLRLLAFQIGQEVSLSEVGQQIGIDGKTVARYIDLLEKSFVLYNLRGFSKNLRKEVVKKSKYYFFDTGIRNSVISNFNSPELRNDLGALWENFLVIERLKKQQYTAMPSNNFFWRTWDQKEIDFLEEHDGKLFTYEFKWKKSKIKLPKAFKEAYPESTFQIINNENYLDFIS